MHFVLHKVRVHFLVHLDLRILSRNTFFIPTQEGDSLLISASLIASAQSFLHSDLYVLFDNCLHIGGG